MNELEPTSEKNQSEKNNIPKSSYPLQGAAGGFIASVPVFFFLVNMGSETAAGFGVISIPVNIVIGLMVGYISNSKKGAFLSGLLTPLFFEVLFILSLYL